MTATSFYVISACYAYIGAFHLFEPLHCDRVTAAAHRVAGVALLSLSYSYYLLPLSH